MKNAGIFADARSCFNRCIISDAGIIANCYIAFN
jgi:hypothetical protein